VNAAKVVIQGQGRIVTAALEPPLPPVERRDLLALLAVAKVALRDVQMHRGAALRKAIVGEIETALAREPRS
jgi:hypothetical protein